MAVESSGGLIDALARGDFGQVLGTAEDYWVDFKRDPYPLDSDKGKWELAKDVCAMAEGRGGLIVIGYESEKRPNEGVELATAHHPVPKELIDPTRYRDCVQERTFPRIVDIKTHWYPPGADANEGVFVIEIPAQEETTKPFMVKRMIDEEEREQVHSVGFPRRDGDRVIWMDPAEIHHEIRMGRRLGERAPGQMLVTTPDNELSDQAFQAATGAVEGEGTPRVAYQALAVSSPSQAEDPLLLERFGAILNEHQPLRDLGFHYRGAQISRQGNAVHALGRSWCLRLEPGLLTVVLLADRECLGWALNQRMPEDAALRINQITLAEMTLEYLRLVHGPVVRGFGFPDMHVKVRAEGMRSGNVVIEPYHVVWTGTPGSLPRGDAPRAQDDSLVTSFPSQGDAEADSYVALAKLYSLWGLSSVPFSEDDRLSSEQVKSF